MAFTGMTNEIERATTSSIQRFLSRVKFPDPFGALSKEEFDAYIVFIAAHI